MRSEFTRRSFLALAASASLVARPRAIASLARPVWHPSPVLTPSDDERGCAMPFSDGCWWSDERQCFLLWYMAGYTGGTGLAQSRDGYVWDRLAIVDDTPRDSSTVWPDGDGGYVRASYLTHEPNALTLYRSPDGVSWRRIGRSPACGDRSTIYRLTDGRWILSARDGSQVRTRRYWVADDFDGSWAPIANSLTELSDGRQLYNFDAAPWQDGYIGLATVWKADHSDRAKETAIALYTSTDGLQWQLVDDSWIQPPYGYLTGNIQTCGGCFVRLTPDTIGIYVSVRSEPKRCVTGLLTLTT